MRFQPMIHELVEVRQRCGLTRNRGLEAHATKQGLAEAVTDGILAFHALFIAVK